MNESYRQREWDVSFSMSLRAKRRVSVTCTPATLLWIPKTQHAASLLLRCVPNILEITELIERGAVLSNYGIFHHQADSPSIKLPRLRNNFHWVGVVYLIIATIKMFQMVNIPIFICIFVVKKKRYMPKIFEYLDSYSISIQTTTNQYMCM